MFGNLAEIHYFKHGTYNIHDDGLNDLKQLVKAVEYSAQFMPTAYRDRVREFLTPESLAVMATFGSLYVASQLTPVGWAADAIVAVTFIGGCVLMGPELLAIAQSLTKFYQTATQAGHREAQYLIAGKHFADAVSKVGFDLLLGVLLHKAPVPLKRKWINYRQGGGVTELKTAVVEEPGVEYVEKTPNIHSGKPQSGRTGYLQSPRLSRSQLAKLKLKANEHGVELEVVKDKRIVGMMDKNNAQAAFDPATGKIYVRPGATYYEVAHEMSHAEQYAKLGKEGYGKLTRLEKETYVYEQLMKQKDKLTEVEMKDALRYINRVRHLAGQPPLNE